MMYSLKYSPTSLHTCVCVGKIPESRICGFILIANVEVDLWRGFSTVSATSSVVFAKLPPSATSGVALAHVHMLPDFCVIVSVFPSGRLQFCHPWKWHLCFTFSQRTYEEPLFSPLMYNGPWVSPVSMYVWFYCRFLLLLQFLCIGTIS